MTFDCIDRDKLVVSSRVLLWLGLHGWRPSTYTKRVEAKLSMMRGFCPRDLCPEGAYILMELCMEVLFSNGVLSRFMKGAWSLNPLLKGTHNLKKTPFP